MASGVAADRHWRTTDVERVEADLAALWQELARVTPISRALMANLVVLAAHAASDDMDLSAAPNTAAVEAVAAKHPSRVIRIHHDPEAADAGRPIAVAVGVITSGPPHARYGVEHIAVRSACGAESLASITRALTIGDIPTSLWWADDVADVGPLTTLALESRQVVYDSRRWQDVGRAVRALAPLFRAEFGPDLADINWRRLGPVRQAMLHAVGSQAAMGRRPSLTIRHRRGEAALAWLLAGWWSAKLATSVSIEEAETDDTLVVDIVDERIRFRLRLTAATVVVEEAIGTSPFVVGVPMEGEADAVAAELRSLTHDACLYDALSALADRFGAA